MYVVVTNKGAGNATWDAAGGRLQLQHGRTRTGNKICATAPSTALLYVHLALLYCACASRASECQSFYVTLKGFTPLKILHRYVCSTLCALVLLYCARLHEVTDVCRFVHPPELSPCNRGQLCKLNERNLQGWYEQGCLCAGGWGGGGGDPHMVCAHDLTFAY